MTDYTIDGAAALVAISEIQAQIWAQIWENYDAAGEIKNQALFRRLHAEKRRIVIEALRMKPEPVPCPAGDEYAASTGELLADLKARLAEQWETHGGALVYRLALEDAADLTDGELARCLAPCAGSSGLLTLAKAARHEGLLTAKDLDDARAERAAIAAAEVVAEGPSAPMLAELIDAMNPDRPWSEQVKEILYRKSSDGRYTVHPEAHAYRFDPLWLERTGAPGMLRHRPEIAAEIVALMKSALTEQAASPAILARLAHLRPIAETKPEAQLIARKAVARVVFLAGLDGDIPANVARAAHYGTSMVPEQRGDQERAGYADTLAGDYDRLAVYATTAEKLATLTEEFDRYRTGYRDRYRAQLSARSRVMSAMITGPARFPTRRNEKRSGTYEKRLRELIDYRTRALAAIEKALRPELRPIMAGDSDANARILEKIAKLEKARDLMKAANAAIRKFRKDGPEAQIAGLGALGIGPKNAAKLLEPDFAGRIGFADYELTNRGSEIRRLRARLVTVERDQATEETRIKGDLATFEDCPAENRVRLFFPGKPASDVIQELKQSGFRWTPSLGCWQAYRSAIERAKRFAGIEAQ